MSEKLPKYADVSLALDTLNAIGGAAETHGLLCALLSGRVIIRREAWLDSLLSKHVAMDDSAIQTAQALLKDLFDGTQAMLFDDQFDLTLLLPEDKSSFTERLEALVQWCQGFLAGLNSMGVTDQTMPAAAGDAIKDLIKIACLDTSTEAESEASETAYAELVEYVRMAAMLLYTELQNKFADKASAKLTLH